MLAQASYELTVPPHICELTAGLWRQRRTRWPCGSHWTRCQCWLVQMHHSRRKHTKISTRSNRLRHGAPLVCALPYAPYFPQSHALPEGRRSVCTVAEQPLMTRWLHLSKQLLLKRFRNIIHILLSYPLKKVKVHPMFLFGRVVSAPRDINQRFREWSRTFTWIKSWEESR